ncbi:MAG: HesA/MoeB/ThiF family protein [Casimicrobiaceae bacterium]
MRPELCIAEADMALMCGKLLVGSSERCAVLFAAQSTRSGRQFRLLVREVEFPDQADYTSQSAFKAELGPLFVAHISKRAAKDKLSLVFVHTHLDRCVPAFSRIDDDGEHVLKAFLANRKIQGNHAAMVLSEGGLRTRLLGTDEELRVVVLGNKRRVAFDPDAADSHTDAAFDRQVRAFGADGQKKLESLCVAIIGLGGTGSIMAQQLVHLGIKKFILIDPDVIENTNLNRIVNATRADLGANKAEVAAQYVRSFDQRALVDVVTGDVARDAVARRMIDADVIMCCTDSHGSRSVIQQVAYQHFIPCIDMGSTITQIRGKVTGIHGRVQLLAPGLPCLWCSELLDAGEVRRDMMSQSERKLDPYIAGSREPAPSVISLNGTVVSLAVTMLLGVAGGAPLDATRLMYDAVRPALRSVHGQPKPDCFICSRKGALAWGDNRPLLARLD